MVEIATAYISIVPDTSKVAPAIKRALGSADVAAGVAGKSAGGRMSSALGVALKSGAAAAGAAGVAAIGTTMVKGFQRLNAIDQAKAKLSGLGNSAGDVTKIMDNALASVKGTAYGMGDAASLAGVMVAAGIKPGRELESTLKGVADSAAIAGTDLQDMGQIWGKAAAKGKIDGEIVNQLLERQIPIYDILGKRMGKSSEEVAAMVSAGKVSFEDFAAAMNDTVGGAALKMGDTVQGALKNVVAAAGRLGASALEPFFKRMPAGLGSMTDAIDDLEPKVKSLSEAFADKVFDDWGPKIKSAFDEFRSSGQLDRMAGAFKAVGSALADVGPSVAKIMGELAKAGAGISWQLLVNALTLGATALEAVNPLLSTTAGLMEKFPGVVRAAAFAFLAFRTIPNLVGRTTAPIAESLARTRVSIRDFGAAYQTSMGYMRQANPSISTAGAHLGVLRGNAVAAGRSLSTSLRGGVKSAISALGGGMSVALLGAGALFTMIMSKNQEAGSSAAAYAGAVDKSRDAQTQLNAALRESGGAMDDNVMSMQAQQLTSYMGELEAATNRTGSALDGFRAEGESLFSFHSIVGGAARTQAQAYEDMGNEAQASIDAINGLGLSTEELASKVYGSQAGFDALVAKLRATGDGGADAAKKLAEYRAEAEKQASLARNVAPGVTELSEAMKVMGDSASTASDKTKALTEALDAMNPARTKGEALAKHAEEMDKIAASTQEAIDQTNGFGRSLLNQKTGVDVTTENGRALRESLLGIIDTSKTAAENGEYTAAVQRSNGEALAGLATQYGLSVEEITNAANALGMDDLDLIMKLSVEDNATQQLGAISQKWQDMPDSKSISVRSDQVTADTEAKIVSLGGIVTRLPNGMVTITAKDEAARARLVGFVNQFRGVDGMVANPRLDINSAAFQEARNQAIGDLRQLDQTNAIPSAGLMIDQLLQGKAVSMNELQALSNTTADPKAKMEIARIMENIATVNRALNDTARPRTANISVAISGDYNFGQSLPGGGTLRGPGVAYNANGSIRQYANGGITALESYANGGDRLPDQAVIQKADPKGGLVQWAEPETKGEAFIPLAPEKRSRSTAILSKVADMFGMSLVSNSKFVSGKAMSGLFGGSESDGVRKFADGGFNGKELTDLANGVGASQPLTGAPYVWGGINWGDCSGAMSAFTRAAAGLDPFGGRWATGSAASDLAAMGYQRGHGGSGDMRVGFMNGGPGGGHTAGTLPDGQNVEMGGGYGGGKLGGTVGASHSQFTDHWFMPVGPSWVDAGEDPGGFTPGERGNMVPGNGDYGAGPGGLSTGKDYGSGGTHDTPKGGLKGILQSFASNAAGIVYDGMFEMAGVDEPWWLGVDIPQLQGGKGGQAAPNGGTAAPATVTPEAQPQAEARPEVKDPGTHKPREGEDLGAATRPELSENLGRETVKQAVQRAFQPRGWNIGAPWGATDYIVNKESTWNPNARNPESGAFGLFQFLGSTKDEYLPDENPDPFIQGQAGSRYIGDRYGDPLKAKQFWDANGWYDKGGIADGKGHMLKNTLRPERVLSPSQTEAFEQGMRRGFGSDTSGLEAKLDQMIEAVGKSAGGTYNVTVADQDAFFREMKVRDRMKAMTYGG